MLKHKRPAGRAGAGRIIHIFNRLPGAVEIAGDSYKVHPSPGGVTRGLDSHLKKYKSIWVGWPGTDVPKAHRESFQEYADRHNWSPVFLSHEQIQSYYCGFSNETLWPLFHSFPSHTEFRKSDWEGYKEVNRLFAEQATQIIEPSDTVWIHDYHLMLLPQLLRERFPGLTIGFFLHIPFPPYEIFRLLPAQWREEILLGLLGADMIGFHTFDYGNYFLQCVSRVTGYTHDATVVKLKDRATRVDTFPISVDYRSLAKLAESAEVRAQAKKFKELSRGQRIVLSVDRLDYTKGIEKRLEAYELLLSENPGLHGRIVLALIAVPSRTDVASYELLKQKIDETIGRINGRFGMPDWAPIMYQYRSLALPELVAWYAASDIALVTPLRDGMNLIAKEYVACRTDSTGVLVLSEMAGAASELGEALIVNPNHVEEIASAIKQALALPAAEQIARNKRMQERLARYDIARFADDFLSHLAEAAEANRTIAQGFLNLPAIASIAGRFKDSLERLILLDYDGTLVPFAAMPHLASPTEEIISLLRTLALDPHTHVALISGRDQHTLEAWFGSLPLTLVGEHGIRIKEKGRPWRFLARVQTKWKKEVRAVLEVFRDRLPGALIEEKDYALAWHYRLANPDLAELRAGELIAALETRNNARAYALVRGHKVVEVRATGPTKGDAVAELLSQRSYDFILGAGDDQTDEDIFRALPAGACSVRVGRGFSAALYRAADYRNIRALLSACIAAAAKMKPTESRLIHE